MTKKQPTTNVCPTSGATSEPIGDSFYIWFGMFGLFMLLAIWFFGYCIPDYKRPVIVELGPKLGSLVESRNHHPALLYTHEMIGTGETLRFEGTIYRITKRGKDCEWGNMYTLERVNHGRSE